MKKINYLKIEKWKPVIGYDELYEVSNLGRVRGAAKKKIGHTSKQYGNIKRPTINKSGYYITLIWKNNHPRAMKVHRLVAEAFIPNPENKRTVNHKNGIKTDNRVENLEWNTHKENIAHSLRNNTFHVTVKNGENHSSAKLKNYDIIEIRILAEMGIRTDTISKVFNVSNNTVSSILRRRIWNHI